MSITPPADERPTLEYQPVRELSAKVIAAQCYLAVVLTLLVIFVATFALVICTMRIGATQALISPAQANGIGFGALLLLYAFAYTLHRSQRRRGYALGIWIGSGIALLIEGLCFATLG